MIARCRLLTPFGLLLISGMLHAQELPTIRRTEYGVPHILANDYRGIGIGIGLPGGFIRCLAVWVLVKEFFAGGCQ